MRRGLILRGWSNSLTRAVVVEVIGNVVVERLHNMAVAAGRGLSSVMDTTGVCCDTWTCLPCWVMEMRSARSMCRRLPREIGESLRIALNAQC